MIVLIRRMPGRGGIRTNLTFQHFSHIPKAPRTDRIGAKITFIKKSIVLNIRRFSSLNTCTSMLGMPPTHPTIGCYSLLTLPCFHFCEKYIILPLLRVRGSANEMFKKQDPYQKPQEKAGSLVLRFDSSSVNQACGFAGMALIPYYSINRAIQEITVLYHSHL